MAPAAQVSILHRASGVLMFLIGIPFMLYLLSQRITGLFMALYTIFLLCSVYTLPQLDYISWSQLFQGQFMKVATMVAVLALIYHAWVGIRDLFMDYLKNTLVRLVLEVGTIVLLTGYASWAAFILWRA